MDTIEEGKVDKIIVILEGFAESYPRASVPRRMLLDVASGTCIVTGLASHNGQAAILFV